MHTEHGWIAAEVDRLAHSQPSTHRSELKPSDRRGVSGTTNSDGGYNRTCAVTAAGSSHEPKDGDTSNSLSVDAETVDYRSAYEYEFMSFWKASGIPTPANSRRRMQPRDPDADAGSSHESRWEGGSPNSLPVDVELRSTLSTLTAGGLNYAQCRPNSEHRGAR